MGNFRNAEIKKAGHSPRGNSGSFPKERGLWNGRIYPPTGHYGVYRYILISFFYYKREREREREREFEFTTGLAHVPKKEVGCNKAVSVLYLIPIASVYYHFLFFVSSVP
jgi:hypothetical protein